MSQAVCTDEFMDQVRERWDRGEAPDAGTVLMENPEFSDRKSLMLELAYEEYFRRVDSGDELDVDSFCRRFSACRMSLQRRIEVHHFLQDESGWNLEIPWPKAKQDFLGFHLLEELGRGVASRVFLAKERDLSDRLVVVKVATHGYREAQILSRLDHPNIVPVYSVERDDENELVAICMPFLTRWTLLDLLDAAYGGDDRPPDRLSVALQRLQETKPRGGAAEQPVRIDPFLRRASFVDGLIHLMVQLAEALDHTHCRGVLHLDLKPTNILLTPEGRPQLLDFNLAMEEPTPDSVPGGTLPYMSPEQIHSTLGSAVEDGGPVDCRSDVYSLGVVFCELLNGRHPFGPVSRGELPSQLAGALLDRQRDLGRRDLTKIAGVDAGLAGAVQKCLETAPADRPQTAGALREDLAACLKPGRRLLRWCRAHPRVVSLASVVFMAAFALVVGSLLMRESPGARHYRRGTALFEKQEYRDAIEEFDLAISADPGEGWYWFARGRARQKLGDFAAAISDFSRARRLTRAPICFAAMGYCSLLKGDEERARAYYQAAVDEGIGSAEVLTGLAYCCIDSKNFVLALDMLDKAIGENPGLAEAYYIRARVLSARAANEPGDWGARAVGQIQTAIDLGLAEAEVMHDAAHIYYFYWTEGSVEARNERVLNFLAEAASNGFDLEGVKAWEAVPGIGDSPRFQEILALPQEARRSLRISEILPDPVHGIAGAGGTRNTP